MWFTIRPNVRYDHDRVTMHTVCARACACVPTIYLRNDDAHMMDIAVPAVA